MKEERTVVETDTRRVFVETSEDHGLAILRGYSKVKARGWGVGLRPCELRAVAAELVFQAERFEAKERSALMEKNTGRKRTLSPVYVDINEWPREVVAAVRRKRYAGWAAADLALWAAQRLSHLRDENVRRPTVATIEDMTRGLSPFGMGDARDEYERAELDGDLRRIALLSAVACQRRRAKSMKMEEAQDRHGHSVFVFSTAKSEAKAVWSGGDYFEVSGRHTRGRRVVSNDPLELLNAVLEAMGGNSAH
jgi:hypothetical protein